MTIKMLKPWTHFNPRNDINEVFIKYDLPQMDVYTCYLESELVFHTSLQLLILDNCDGNEPVVVVQFAEQYNGQHQNATLEQFRTICNDCEGWDEVLQVLEAKLKELELF